MRVRDTLPELPGRVEIGRKREQTEADTPLVTVSMAGMEPASETVPSPPCRPLPACDKPTLPEGLETPVATLPTKSTPAGISRSPGSPLEADAANGSCGPVRIPACVS